MLCVIYFIVFVVYVYCFFREHGSGCVFPLFDECEWAYDEVVFVLVVICSFFDE